MPTRNLRIPAPAAHGPARRAQRLQRQTLLRALRRHLQPQILTTQLNRRRLLRHQLPQHPLPSLPSARAFENTASLRAADLWVPRTR